LKDKAALSDMGGEDLTDRARIAFAVNWKQRRI
jgi:hypothetical protein